MDLHFRLLYTVVADKEAKTMERTFEAPMEKRDKWYIGWVDAVPGAFSQGKSIGEVEENLKEAVQLILETEQELKRKGGAQLVLKRKIQVQS